RRYSQSRGKRATPRARCRCHRRHRTPNFRRAAARDRAFIAGAPSRPGASRRACRSGGANRAAWRGGGTLLRFGCDRRGRRAAAPLACQARRNSQVGFLPPPGQRVALAQDRAFSFVYPHVLEAWRSAGAEIMPFSPLADEAPPQRADSCWLPGGYPELHAQTLATAQNFAKGLRRFAQTRPVHGECGGHMVLGQVIEDSDGRTHVMTGLLGHTTSFAKRKLHLGYRTARLLSDGVLGRKGALVRGHEFHYASLTAV